jgi:lipopolysaccharide biosynthesis glycosyltransferase
MRNANILVTIDSNYVLPLKVMLNSLFINNPQVSFDIYIIHSDLSNEVLEDLNRQSSRHGAKILPVFIGSSVFSAAPVFKHFTKAMYYRLLAFKLLPESLDKVLYLDPDILVINPIDRLYNIDLTGCLFAAASHTMLTPLTKQINKLRLKTGETQDYYNSGVLLMNLELLRSTVNVDEIFKYAEEHRMELLLPDQDILNGMFGKHILSLDDSLYNYDARKGNTYYISSLGVKDLDWVLKNTVILHFCGKQKPWQKGYISRFAALYKHYQRNISQ